MSEITYAYKVGELIECMDPASHKWREAFVTQLAGYRGRPGYYTQWHPLPKYDPENGVFISPSTGGWTHEAWMRRKQAAA